MKPIHKKYCKTAALIWTACLVLLVIAYFVLLAPQKKIMKQLEEQLVQTKQSYENVQQSESPEAKEKLYKQLEVLKDKLAKFAIDIEDTADLTFNISKIANEKNVSSFTIKDKSSKGGTELPGCSSVSEHQISINFKSGFTQFASVLNALERHHPFVFIDNFAISRSQQDDLSHDINMNLAVYARKKQDS